MSEINAYYIQTVLEQQKAVTLPWIQHTFSLSYREAKEFLEVLMRRGWVKREAEEHGYAVQHEFLRLRTLRRNEVTSLIKRMTDDNAAVLKLLLTEPCNGISYEEVHQMLRRGFLCRAVLENLQEAKLIYRADDRFFCCVSAETVHVLDEVARVKENVETMSETERKEAQKAIRKLFEDLF